MEKAARSMEKAARTGRKRMTCILSVDGGGIRGVIPTTVLLFLEHQLQKLDGPYVRIADYFDVIAGTSTGGIIGGILTTPDEKGRSLYSVEDAMKLYMEQGPKIFPKRYQSGILRWLSLVMQLKGPKHRAEALESILKENLKDLKMKDTLSELLIPTFDIKKMQPVFFSTSEAQKDESMNAYVWDVLRGTSAAPTYFPPHIFNTTTSNGETRNFNLVDGGVGINNPTHLSISHTLHGQAKKKSGETSTTLSIEDYKNLLVLSLGTGKFVKSYDAKDVSDWGVLSWIRNNGQVPIIDIFSECSSDVVDYNLSIFFSILQCPQNFLRIQAFDIYKDVQALDNATIDNIQKLREIGEGLLDMPVDNLSIENGDSLIERGQSTNKENLVRFAKELSKEYRARRSL